MSLPYRLFLGAFVLLTLASGGRAQNVPGSAAPSEKTIENWLHGDDPRLVAWGAHFAMTRGSQALIADLQSLANKWQRLPREDGGSSAYAKLSPRQIDSRDAMAVVVDALIQMNADVSSETVSNLAPDFPNDVAVLLSRMPTEEAQPLAFNFCR